MSIRACVYFKDKAEQEQVKLFLATLRAKEAGLSVVQVRQTTERALGNGAVAKVVDDMSAEHFSDEGLIIVPKNTEKPPRVWLTCIDRLWEAGCPENICEELNNIPYRDINAEMLKRGYKYVESEGKLYKIKEPYKPAEPKSEDALPSSSEREIPVTLRPFISQGWDLDTAFRIYDEWHADMSKITDKTSYVKSLYERFIEERKKQYADESAE